MFSKVIPRIKEYYFLPVLVMMPIRAFTEGYEEHIICKNAADKSLTHHTFCCFMGAFSGLRSMTYQFTCFIGRCIDKK